MLAPDFLRLWAPATESIVVLMVEGARVRRRKKDKRERIKRSLSCRDTERVNIA